MMRASLHMQSCSASHARSSLHPQTCSISCSQQLASSTNTKPAAQQASAPSEAPGWPPCSACCAASSRLLPLSSKASCSPTVMDSSASTCGRSTRSTLPGETSSKRCRHGAAAGWSAVAAGGGGAAAAADSALPLLHAVNRELAMPGANASRWRGALVAWQRARAASMALGGWRPRQCLTQLDANVVLDRDVRFGVLLLTQRHCQRCTKCRAGPAAPSSDPAAPEVEQRIAQSVASVYSLFCDCKCAAPARAAHRPPAVP